MKARHKNSRSTIALIIVAVVITGFAATLFDTQIVKYEYYASQSNAVKTYTVPIEAARGEIVDRNGNSLVTNRRGNSIILDAAYFPGAADNDKRNEIILNLINLFEASGEEYAQNLPLVMNVDGSVHFSDDEGAVMTMKSADMLGMQTYATAQNCYNAMVKKYSLQQYDKATALKIGNIRYELTRLLFDISTPVTIADDVSNETVAAIKEDKTKYAGADVQVAAYREYVNSTVAPHILGTVRDINADEYKELKSQGYKITDQIGESGIEAAMESDLRGTPGEKTITIDNDGKISEQITKTPVQGNTIVLSIDRDMQILAQDKLKKTCDSVDLSSSAGAVVVEDVNNGEILAAASYPTYDLADYYTKYTQLANNSRKPLWSRFAMGTYAPGSTFKPMMACIALEEGVISENTVFNCTGRFEYYGHTFKCPHQHGSENVRTALRDSCNTFFYNCADKLGINKMNEYGAAFGLGEKTGVEISEASGILAGPAEREAAGGNWWIGDAVQSAIGQSDNLFSPLQLCNYVSVIANGGTRYEMHFVKAIINSATGTVSQTGAKIADNVELSDSTLSIVRSGMRLVATDGAPSSVFNKLNVNIACKTGTSVVYEKGVKRNNGFLISYAPYEAPEIAIASAIELAGSGTSTSEITASIIDYWYSNNSNEKSNQESGTILE